jgi:predicted ATPase
LAELAAVQDVTFAYRRALSRLQEMQRKSYWRERHGAVIAL